MRKRLRLILGGLFFALMFVFAAGNAVQTFEYRQSTPGFGVKMRGGRVLIEQVGQAGAAAGLRAGDEVVSLDGRKVETGLPVFELLSAEPGRAFTVAIGRDGQVRELNLRTVPFPHFMQFLFTLVLIVIPATFLVTGFAVFILKPDDKQAVLLALMLGMFVPADTGLFTQLHASVVALMIVGGVVSSFFGAVFFHFFLVFPERSPLLRRFPRLEYALYIPQTLLLAPFVFYTSVLAALGPERLFEMEERLAPFVRVVNVLVSLYLLAGVVSLLVNYRQASRQSRRKMRVVVAGCTLGLLPSIAVLVCYFYGLENFSPAILRALSAVSTLALLLLPSSFIYAIARHQVIPVRLIIRRGIRYVFVSQGSVVVEIIAVGLGLTLVLTYIFRYLHPSSGLVIGVVSGLFSVLVWNVTSTLHHRIIAPSIDRRFFRRAYNAQQILAETGQALRAMADVREMTRLVSTKMQDALQTESASIFLQDHRTGDYTCAISSHYVEDGRVAAVTTERGLVLARDSFVARRFKESPQPLVVDFQDPQSWAARLLAEEAGADEARLRESEALKRVNASLLLPVATKEQLLGVISLGPRLGDLPFSRQDIQMLLAVAWQMAFAIENAQLVRRKIEEEGLRRELEMATQVQRRLFPDCPPRTEGLELAGVCHPARGVGGDYYDFLLLDDGCVGVAVADVAGKGISAALLMSTVQASLRSQARSVGGQLTELVASMNRLLNSSTDSASYASFFYAQFDERTRLLTYVNAGHNPPMLLRRAAQEATLIESSVAREAAHRNHRTIGAADGRGFAATASLAAAENSLTDFLTTGGPVIGLFDDLVYEQEVIRAESGDVIVAYTDGVTEALNPDGEEFGCARLQAILEESSQLPAVDLMERIVERLEDWCLDTPQHDDMTLVVLKVK
jgi:sigma-B regulation protein RsbU (phosphoserine phosphatase)